MNRESVPAKNPQEKGLTGSRKPEDQVKGKES